MSYVNAVILNECLLLRCSIAPEDIIPLRYRQINILLFPSPSLAPSSFRLVGPQTRKPRIVPEESFNRAGLHGTATHDAREGCRRERENGETTETRKEDGRERVDATTRKDRPGGRRRGAGGSARGRRTSSDFSAVAAASERAALLCTSSLMASPVQPWLGSVLYHTAGRVPRFPSPLPSSHSPLVHSAARSARRARSSALTLSLFLSSSLYLGPSLPLDPVA